MASVRKRGRSYTITAYMGYDADHRQRRKTTTWHPPAGASEKRAEKLALAYAVTWENEIRGYVGLNENRTFKELMDWYYDTIAPMTLKPNVCAAYRRELENHIVPYLGPVRLKNITPVVLDEIMKRLLQSGNLNRSCVLKKKSALQGVNRERFCQENDLGTTCLYAALKGKAVRKENAQKIADALGLPLDDIFTNASKSSGLTPSSVNKIMQNVSAVFTAAVKKEIIRRNPCSFVSMPRAKAGERKYLDRNQCRRFLQAVQEKEDIQWEALFNLMLATGMRSGEIRALHWADIDTERRELDVRYTLVRFEGRYVRQTPKTRAGERKLCYPEYVGKLLQKHRKEQEERKKAHKDWQVPDAVFTNGRGDYLLGNALNAELKKILKEYALPDIHVHSLRHTYASLLINAEVPARIVADMLGHARTGTTLDIYSHVFASSEKKAMMAIEKLLYAES